MTEPRTSEDFWRRPKAPSCCGKTAEEDVAGPCKGGCYAVAASGPHGNVRVRGANQGGY